MRLFSLASIFLLVAATAEAGSNVKALGKQFRKLDANHDQSLTSDEFDKVLPSKLTRNNALLETQAEIFAWFDEDSSEGIDLGEWIDGKTASGADCPDFTDEVQDELDANGDGKLTWKEFSRVMNAYVPSKTARGWLDAVVSSSSTGSSLSLGGSSSSSGGSISGGTLSIASGSSFFVSGGYQGGTSVNGVTNISGSIVFPSDSNSSLTLAPSAGSTTASGTLTFDSGNTYTGSTTVSSGSLNSSYTVDSGVSLSASSGFDFTTGTGTLTLAGGTLSSGGTLTFGGNLAIVDFGGPISGSGTVTTMEITGSGGIVDTATLFFGDAGAIALNDGSDGTVLGVTQTDGSQNLSGTFTSAQLNTFFGATSIFDGSLTIADFGGYDISALTSTYYLSAPVSETPVSSIDQSGSGVSE